MTTTKDIKIIDLEHTLHRNEFLGLLAENKLEFSGYKSIDLDVNDPNAWSTALGQAFQTARIISGEYLVIDTRVFHHFASSRIEGAIAIYKTK